MKALEFNAGKSGLGQGGPAFHHSMWRHKDSAVKNYMISVNCRISETLIQDFGIVWLLYQYVNHYFFVNLLQIIFFCIIEIMFYIF